MPNGLFNLNNICAKSVQTQYIRSNWSIEWFGFFFGFVCVIPRLVGFGCFDWHMLLNALAQNLSRSTSDCSISIKREALQLANK